MFENLRRAAAASRIADEVLYEQVVLELAEGEKRLGLWAKALSDCQGDEQKARALYIRYRVQSIKDEIEVLKAERQKSFVDNSASSERPPEKTALVEVLPSPLPVDPGELVDMLADVIDSEDQYQQASLLIEKLRSIGFDNDTIELLIEDRLGANGVHFLWELPGFSKD
ncbi:MAG: hypothetical protein CVU24_00660 [Betaproteobacteria bacterium HGW-Betaproteobacteria-18]|jgi:hypothetical protein|nr:MAG: hypothetical protein CVU24_00660 [Betaproteobacteria bacterium HGW-Betaproteobacteria-18]